MLVSHSMDEIARHVHAGAVDRGRASWSPTGPSTRSLEAYARRPERAAARRQTRLLRQGVVDRRWRVVRAEADQAVGHGDDAVEPRRGRRRRSGHDHRAHPDDAAVEHERRHRPELDDRPVGVEQGELLGDLADRRRSRSGRRAASPRRGPACGVDGDQVDPLGRRRCRRGRAAASRSRAELVAAPAPGLNGHRRHQVPGEAELAVGWNIDTWRRRPRRAGGRRRSGRPPTATSAAVPLNSVSASSTW